MQRYELRKRVVVTRTTAELATIDAVVSVVILLLKGMTRVNRGSRTPLGEEERPGVVRQGLK
jgi:hypothetical protein